MYEQLTICLERRDTARPRRHAGLEEFRDHHFRRGQPPPPLIPTLVVALNADEPDIYDAERRRAMRCA